ncbi:MAG: ComEC/Rec2 family competence protein [Bacteroidota bacterium]
MFAGYWHHIPFVRVIIPMCIGIGINMFFPMPLLVNGIGLIVSFVLLLAVWHFSKYKMRGILFGLCFNISCYFTGVAIHNSHNHLNYANHYTYHQAEQLLVEVIEPAQMRKHSIKCKLRVLKVYNHKISTDVDGLLLAYFKKDAAILTKLKYGTHLLIKSDYKLIKEPQNPYEFNYKRYLGFNQIYRQIYLQANDFLVVDNDGGNGIWQLAYGAQDFFNVALQQYVNGATEIAILKALLYGFDDDIDPDLVRAYSNTGTLHVLAVSGMHVGLIFWLINLVLRYFDKRHYQRMFKAIISIACIWAYSVLCGLSPSILRASVMFSFVAVGSAFKNKPNIYNTLAASAFTLLLFDSNMLANVGFQLSFLAVFGIVSLQKYFKQWFSFDTWIMNEIWTIISVSIAAQLATFPLGLLYFHQFPVYFMASNLLIIPLTTVIIFVAIGMIVLAGLTQVIPVLSIATLALGYIVKYLIVATNYIVVWLEKLPFSFIAGIHINEIETILIFVLVAYTCNYFISRKQYLFKYALICLLLLAITHTVEQIKISKQQFICLYNINKTFAMQIFQGNKSTLIADASLLNDRDKFHFHIQQHIWACGIESVDTIAYTQPLQLQIQNTTIGIDASIHPNTINILTQKEKIDTTPLFKQNELVLLSSKLNNRQMKVLLEVLNTKNLSAKNVCESGAITINLEP